MTGDLEAQYRESIGSAEQDTGAPNLEQQYRESIFSEETPATPEVRAVLLKNLDANPEQAARARSLGSRLGLPVDLVERNLPELEKKAKFEDQTALLSKSPKLARALQADPSLGRIGTNDLPTLAQIEVAGAKMPRARPLTEAFPFRPASEDMRRQRDRFDTALSRALGSANRVTGPAPDAASIAAGVSTAVGNEYENSREGLRLQLSDMLGLDDLSEQNNDRRRDRDFETEVTTPAIDSATGRGLYGALVSLGVTAPTIAASFALGPAAGLALMGAQAQTSAYGKYRERGGEAGESFVAATGEGVVEAATEKLALGFMVNRLGKVGFGQFVTGLLAREIPGEQVATFVQDAIDTAVANPEKSWDDYWAERAGRQYETLVSTIGQAAIMGGAGRVMSAFATRDVQARQAEDTQRSVKDLIDLVQATDIVTRSPETLAQFIDEAAGEVKDIYIDARAFEQAVGPEGVQELRAVSPSLAAQYDEAIQAGGDIVIPVGEFTTTIGATESVTSLLPHLRAAAEDMSAEDAKVYLQEREALMDEQAKQALAEVADVSAFEASAAAVERTLTEQLAQANRFTSAANQQKARILAAFYRTMAARKGVLPEEVFKQYAVRVQAEGVTGGREFDQITPQQARGTNVELSMPQDPVFTEAVGNTEGAQITPDGLLIDLVRFQKPEQEGAQAIRTGVFYLPSRSKNARHYRTSPSSNNAETTYGGTEKMSGTTLIRRPLFVKGATGGRGPEAAYVALKGKDALKALDKAVLDVVSSRGFMTRIDADSFLMKVEQFLGDFGGARGMASAIVRNSKKGNTLRYALQEHVIAHAVRAAGYDAVVGYSKGKAGAFLSEVFDVREQTFPARGIESAVHSAFLQTDTGLSGRRTSLDNFRPGNVSSILARDDWTILTAHNPMGVQLSPEENAARNELLVEELQKRGLEFDDSIGKYVEGNNLPEDGFIVYGVTPQIAHEIGNMFDQDSVLINRGLLYHDNTLNPVGGGLVEHDTAPDNYFTRVPSTGALFTMNIDFKTRVPFVREFAQTADRGRVDGITVVHYSNEPRVSLSSSFYGRGMKGAEYERVMASPDRRLRERIHFYVSSGTQVVPESNVGNVAHVARVSNLYDADLDHLKLRKGRDANGFESAVLDSGYSGYISRAVFGKQGAVVMLGKQDVNVKQTAGAMAELTVPPAPRFTDAEHAAREIAADKRLPAGAQTPSSWRDYISRVAPDWNERIGPQGWVTLGRLFGDTAIYRADLGRVFDTPARTFAQPFYSTLSAAVEASDTKAAAAAGWLQFFKSQVSKGAVKQDEIAWTGVEEWLATQQGKVTREALAGFLRDNGVRVEEVVLTSAPSRQFDVQDTGLVFRVTVDGVPYGEETYEVYGEAADVVAELRDEEEARQQTAQTTYDDYTLPGGENYREVLLTLPSDTSGVAYQSSHWKPRNVLAHLRLNDRTDTDGKRVLFVEEIQSDWAQEGKKKGFEQPELTTQQRAAKMSEAKALTQAIRQRSDADREAGLEQISDQTLALNQADGEKVSAIMAELERDRAAVLGNFNRIPRAPFVDKTDKWVALALKRVIKMAVDGGYDRVALVTGEQSADRYDLSKQIDRIDYSKNGDGTYNLSAVKNNFEIFSKENMTEEELADTVGKEVAVKIAGGEGQPAAELDEVSRWEPDDAPAEEFDYGKSATLSLSGLDLKVGGEGMVAFYDKIVPSVLKDVLKKVGGGTVSQVQVPTREPAQIPLMGIGYDETTGKRYLSKFGSDDRVDPRNFDTYAEADAERERMASAAEAGLTSQPGFDITPAMREKAAGGLPLFSQGEDTRGQIAFGTDITQQPSVITLFEKANLSTFLHEAGHFMFEVMADMASRPDAPASVVEDVNKLLKWFGVPDLATWRAMTPDQQRPHHERMARATEVYFFEGKAPSQELHGLFATFRAWLLNVYKRILATNATLDAALQVNISDEVRGVLDRMLATDEQIKAAADARGFAPLFKTAEEMGATQAEWEAYQSENADALREATEQQQARSLRDMQWLSRARGRVLRELQRQAAETRKAVEAEATATTRAEPVYAAMRWLKHGEMVGADGELIKAATGFKLDIDMVRALFPDDLSARPDLTRLGFGKYGMVMKEGLDPQIVAEMFGFHNGIDLVMALTQASPEAEAIEGLTDQLMLERYGDLNSQEAMERAADEALHNEARGRFVATELRALAKALNKTEKTPRGSSINSLARAAKDLAAQLIARKKIKDLRPSQHSTAEARAGRAAQKALTAGDLRAAVTEKRNQLVNMYAAKRAYEAREEVEQGLRSMKRNLESDGIDQGYKDQIAQILDQFQLRPLTQKEQKRAKSLVEWVEAQKAAGYEPVIDPQVLNNARRVPIRELTMEEFRGVVDAIENIAHLGRLKKKLLTAKDARDFAARVAEAEATIRDNAKRSIPEELEPSGRWPRFKSGVKEFFVMHVKFANQIREMDGWVDGGPLWELFVRPMNEAGDKEATMREQATVRLSALFDTIKGSTKKIYIPEIKASLSLEGRLMVALNTGNEGNLQRLMDGDRWTMAQVQAVVNTLTKEQMDFVQAIWDMLDEYRPMIGAQQKRLTGVEPEWVQPIPVQTPHGTYRGGYMPAKYDTKRSTRSLSDEAASNVMDLWRAARNAPRARDGFTKARADAVMNRPLRKDFGVITQHITEVTHRLAFQDWLIDAQRLLRAGPIDGAIREHYGPEVLKGLNDTVADIAAGEVGAQNIFEASANWLRTGATITGLGWRLTTGLLQPLGLTQSMVRIGPKWVAKGLAQWLGSAVKMENAVEQVYAKSEFMRLRGKTMNREVSEIRNKVSGRDSRIQASYFYLIQKLQIVADMPTWLGQYTKSIEGGESEARAVALADQAVLDAQSGGQVKDLSAIQRGSPLLKLFTNFYSFFNTTYNLTRESVGRTNFKSPASIGLLAVDMLLLYTVPAVLGELMKAALDVDEPDEEELAAKLVAAQANYLLGTMVGLREIGGAVSAAFGLPSGYGGPAGVRFFSELQKLAKQYEQGDKDEAFFKALNSAAGILFHYPAGQINNSLSGLAAMIEGRTENPAALITGGPRP